MYEGLFPIFVNTAFVFLGGLEVTIYFCFIWKMDENGKNRPHMYHLEGFHNQFMYDTRLFIAP